MSGQFKKPFPNPEKRSQKSSRSDFISEQETIKPPAVQASGAPDLPPHNALPPRGYIQGRHARYGAQPNGAPLPGNGAVQRTPMAFPQAPAPSAPFHQGGRGNGPLNRPGMGPAQTPNPAWSAQARALPEKPVSLSGMQPGKKNRKRRRIPVWARVIIGFLTFILLLGGAGFWYYQANFASAVGSITGKNFSRPKGVEDPNSGKTGSILNWGRVNILLLGSDTDEKGNWSGNRFLAQTVIVVTVDTTTHDVGVLSIPRDFWIPIPACPCLDKLDTAFAYGGSINNNMSGVGAVVQTLDQDFGIPINFYAWVGLQGFVKVIDTVGGVDVDVMHPVVDDTYPDDVNNNSGDHFAYKRLYIPDGPQHLDGPTALEYVRSRHTSTDFNRSARQQEVLGALKLKLQNAGIIGELPQIAKDLQGSVYTELKPDQVFDLMRFARGIDTSKIRHLTLGPPYARDATRNQTSIVIPNCSALVPAINQFLHITSGKCNIGSASQLLSSAAPSYSLSEPLNAPVQSTMGESTFPPTSQMVATTATSSLDPWNDLFGLRDLLDLMSLVVLGSPQL